MINGSGELTLLQRNAPMISPQAQASLSYLHIWTVLDQLRSSLAIVGDVWDLFEAFAGLLMMKQIRYSWRLPPPLRRTWSFLKIVRSRRWSYISVDVSWYVGNGAS